MQRRGTARAEDNKVATAIVPRTKWQRGSEGETSLYCYIQNSILNNKKQTLSIYINVILCKKKFDTSFFYGKKKLAKIFAPRMSQKPLF